MRHSEYINRKIVEKAKDYLRHNPIDATHGLRHHKAVVENCLKIIAEEHVVVDKDSLVIAAWWHDIESQEGKTELLRKEMVSQGFNKRTVEFTCAIIRSHTYGGKQKTNEAKILFDADKMEYFNPKRIRVALKDAKRGVLPVSALKKHYQSWLERHQYILNSFHFYYSKNIALSNLKATSSAIEKIKTFLESSK